MNVDPRLFGSAHSVMNGQPSGIDTAARGELAHLKAEIARLKQFIATKVGSDVALLTKAANDLNSAIERLEGRVGALEQGAQFETETATVQGEVVEAANVRPGDENLPPAYFQGADEESAP